MALQVAVNGVVDTTTSDVIFLLYETGGSAPGIYLADARGDWFYRASVGDSWNRVAGDPRIYKPSICGAGGLDVDAIVSVPSEFTHEFTAEFR